MAFDKKFFIKLAEVADAESIVGIVKQSFVQYCRVIGLETIDALQESEDDVILAMESMSVYIAYYDGKPVGSFRLKQDGNKVILSRFAVLPEFQRLGIGSKILKYAEESSRRSDVEMIELYSATEHRKLKNYYIRHGFKVVEVSEAKGYKRGVFQKQIT